MEIQPEVLWGGIACGFAACAWAIRRGYEQSDRIERVLGERIAALEGSLNAARDFERETLVGLVLDSTDAVKEHRRNGARLARVIEIMRLRYGDEVLRAAEEARHQAVVEDAETSRTERRP